MNIFYVKSYLFLCFVIDFMRLRRRRYLEKSRSPILGHPSKTIRRGIFLKKKEYSISRILSLIQALSISIEKISRIVRFEDRTLMTSHIKHTFRLFNHGSAVGLSPFSMKKKFFFLYWSELVTLYCTRRITESGQFDDLCRFDACRYAGICQLFKYFKHENPARRRVRFVNTVPHSL